MPAIGILAFTSKKRFLLFPQVCHVLWDVVGTLHLERRWQVGMVLLRHLQAFFLKLVSPIFFAFFCIHPLSCLATSSLVIYRLFVLGCTIPPNSIFLLFLCLLFNFIFVHWWQHSFPTLESKAGWWKRLFVLRFAHLCKFHFHREVLCLKSRRH